jgi:hypothetical protein
MMTWTPKVHPPTGAQASEEIVDVADAEEANQEARR